MQGHVVKWTTAAVVLSLAACSSTMGTAPTDDGGAPNADAAGDEPGSEGCDACGPGKQGDAEGTTEGGDAASTFDATLDADGGGSENDGSPNAGDSSDVSDSSLMGDGKANVEGDAAVLTEAGAGDSSTTPEASSGAGGDAGSDASGSTLVCSATPCTAGETLCGGLCVSISDPAYGCGSCGTCSPPHAMGVCGGDAGACRVGSCEPGWADTDGNPSNGCETDLTSPSTCTSALLSCSGATPYCAPTGCVAACTPPLTTCGNSCVSLTSSASHCGSCSNACTAPTANSFPTCTNSGTCGTPVCPTGQIVCSGGCVNPQTDGSNCGGCGHTCPAVTNSVGTCSGGTCGAVCEPGWSVCGSACTVLGTDPQNCGSCGHACGGSMNCVGGACEPASSIWLATGLSTPAAITTDSQDVYWVDPGNGSVNAVAKTGGSINVLAANRAKPTGIAVDDTYAYWGDNLGGAILRTLKVGGDTAHVVAAVTSPNGVVIDANYVYTLDGSGVIERAPKAENATASIFATAAIGTYSDLQIDGANLYVFGTNGASGTFIFQIDTATGTVENSSVLGELHVPSGYVVSNGVAAASSGTAGASIVWLNLASNSSFSFFSNFTFQPWPDAIASCGIVSFESQEGMILLPYGTKVPTLLLASVSPKSMIVDNDTVYWTDGSGAIGALPLP